MSRTVQRKTSTVDTNAVIGQNASNLSSKPFMNQNVSVTQPTDQYIAIIQEVPAQTPEKESVSS